MNSSDVQYFILKNKINENKYIIYIYTHTYIFFKL